MSSFESRRQLSLLASAGPASGVGHSPSRHESGCQFFVRFGSVTRTVVLQAKQFDTTSTLKSMLASRLEAPGLARFLRMTYNGHDLPDDVPLAAVGVQDGSTLSAMCRARGGGGDGGSTGAESRSCYLEMYAQKKPDKVDPTEEKLAKWTRCHLSGEALQPPCVCDELGSLYNKDAVVNALLHKSMPTELQYISSLKHLTNLKLTPSPNSSRKGATPGSFTKNDADFQCPVTGLEMNGRFRFLVHKPTGHVVSERALKDVAEAVEELIGQKWAAAEWVPLNPTGEELEKLQEQVLQRVAADAAKKSKKKASAEGADGALKKRAAAPAAAAPVPKKVKATDHMPAVATKDVYASLFTSSETHVEKETFTCRSTGARPRIG